MRIAHGIAWRKAEQAKGEVDNPSGQHNLASIAADPLHSQLIRMVRISRWKRESKPIR
jgi:hypothetical protein